MIATGEATFFIFELGFADFLVKVHDLKQFVFLLLLDWETEVVLGFGAAFYSGNYIENLFVSVFFEEEASIILQLHHVCNVYKTS